MFSEASVSHSVRGGGSASRVCFQKKGLPPEEGSASRRGLCIQGSLHRGGGFLHPGRSTSVGGALPTGGSASRRGRGSAQPIHPHTDV